MTSSLLKGDEDLTGELFHSTLAFSLEGEGVLYEPTFPALETSIARWIVRNCIVQKIQEYTSIEIYWVTSLKNPIKEKECPLRTM